ncbi:hypothetical protein PRVXH_001565 [Proteinivorax hydrogeniformans]|uniref:Transposase n=1 Tax=Proteinivorax hydrogeniformans TaxID=1826727 RepID=A0AAU8HPU1_9FIRM
MLCQVAGVARSAYYKWLNRKETKLEIENKLVKEKMIEIFDKSDGIFGYRRLKMYLDKSLKRALIINVSIVL